MKKILFFLLLVSCYKAYSKDNVRIHGKITNPIADSIKVSYSLASIVYRPDEYCAKLNGDGSFNIDLNVKDGFNFIRIIHGNQETSLFVQPGADLALTLDAKNFDSTLHYEGKGKELANFMAKHVLQIPAMQAIEVQGQMACKEDPEAFEAALKKLEEKELNFLQENGADLPAGFADYFKTDCRYKVYSLLENYPHFHEMIKQKSMSVKDIPKEDYVVIEDLPEAFNDNYLDLISYHSYITNFFSVRIASAMSGSGLPRERWPSGDSILKLAYEQMPPKTAEFFAGSNICLSLKHQPLEKVEMEYEDYKMHFPHSKNLDILQQEITHKKTFGNGKPAVDFDINTPEGKHMKLSDLKGNVVYIDFWSRGCAPCVAEMPDSKKIRAYFKDKPVSFVYISLDPEDDVWKKAIKDYDVDGINTHVDKDWQSETVKKYGVIGIPGYFLVDKEGNFASADDLARPSNSKILIAQIEKLLK